jgi:hypothetical protein
MDDNNNIIEFRRRTDLRCVNSKNNIVCNMPPKVIVKEAYTFVKANLNTGKFETVGTIACEYDFSNLPQGLHEIALNRILADTRRQLLVVREGKPVTKKDVRNQKLGYLGRFCEWLGIQYLTEEEEKECS